MSQKKSVLLYVSIGDYIHFVFLSVVPFGYGHISFKNVAAEIWPASPNLVH